MRARSFLVFISILVLFSWIAAGQQRESRRTSDSEKSVQSSSTSTELAKESREASGESDEDHLEYAHKTQRVTVTHDDDFLKLHAAHHTPELLIADGALAQLAKWCRRSC